LILLLRENEKKYKWDNLRLDMKKESKEIDAFYKSKAEFRNFINLTLLGACFTIFALIISIKPELLKNNPYLAFQLVASIPLMMVSILARSKFWIHEKGFDMLGFGAFTLGYVFLLNVVGILLINFVSFFIGIAFLLVSIICALVYSSVNVYYDRKSLKERMMKDGIFILLIILLGVVPNL